MDNDGERNGTTAKEGKSAPAKEARLYEATARLLNKADAKLKEEKSAESKTGKGTTFSRAAISMQVTAALAAEVCRSSRKPDDDFLTANSYSTKTPNSPSFCSAYR